MERLVQRSVSVSCISRKLKTIKRLDYLFILVINNFFHKFSFFSRDNSEENLVARGPPKGTVVKVAA